MLDHRLDLRYKLFARLDLILPCGMRDIPCRNSNLCDNGLARLPDVVRQVQFSTKSAIRFTTRFSLANIPSAVKGLAARQHWKDGSLQNSDVISSLDGRIGNSESAEFSAAFFTPCALSRPLAVALPLLVSRRT